MEILILYVVNVEKEKCERFYFLDLINNFFFVIFRVCKLYNVWKIYCLFCLLIKYLYIRDVYIIIYVYILDNFDYYVYKVG